MMGLHNVNMWFECIACHRCSGAYYQSPPLLGIFDKSPVLVIAQNPGEAKNNRPEHIKAAANMMAAAHRSHVATLSDLYERDFRMSFAYKVGLARFFGDDWLDHFDYTNAVRCRTPGNEVPSDEMVTNCWDYTSRLIKKYQAVITVGSVARLQLPFGLPKMVVKRGKSGRVYLAIPHYAARAIDDVLIRKLVDKVVNYVADF